MKAQFLKLTGVKTEKEFYDKFPTEEAFMAKYGKKLKKAQFGVNMATAINPNLMQTPNFNGMLQRQAQTNYMEDIQGIDQGNIFSQGTFQQPNVGRSMSIDSQPFDFTGAGEALGSIVQGVQAIGDQKRAYKNTKMNRKVSDVALRASRIRPEQPQRTYDRPEDYSITGEELFPIYGRGSNVLAKNGKKMYQTGGIMPFGEMMSTGGGQALDGVARGIFDNNAGYQLGSGIGKAVNFIPGVGPVVGAIASPVLGTIGGVLDQAFGTAGKMKKEQSKLDRNIRNMGMNAIGQSVSGMNRASMAYGGKMAMGGELEMLESSATPISYNPYIPGGGETVRFNGDSHSDGGQLIKYNDNLVEVEGGEPATQLPDNETGQPVVSVFGNLKIPKFFAEEVDPLAKNKKFKNYIKDLSKIEDKQNQLISRMSKKATNLNQNDTFDRITQNSVDYSIKGANMKLADIAQKKMAASELQDTINKASEMYNLDPNALVKGEIKPISGTNKGTAKYGKVLMAQDGTTTDPKKLKIFSSAEQAKKQGFTKQPDGTWARMTKKGTKETVEVIPGSTKTIQTEDSAGKIVKTYKNQMSNEAWKEYLKNETPEQKAKRYAREQKEGYREGFSTKGEKVITTPDTEKIIPATDPEFEYAKIVSPEIIPVEYKRNPLVDGFNQVLPFLRPSNDEPLDARQLYGEMFAMATNQLEPVQTQSYQPLLDVPYDISLQDQLNEVTASSRAASRLAGYNPSFQSNVAAQEQMNKAKILGEQFRLNQGMKDRVYANNRATLNDARLKNIGLYDQQYVRQAEALSNTKQTNQLALNSISDKYLKNDLNNRNLQLMENMYNYRFDRRGRAINMNPLYQPNIPQVGAQTGQDLIPIEDEQGNVVKYQLRASGNNKPSMSTPGYVGNAKNGSIVRALKTL